MDGSPTQLAPGQVLARDFRVLRALAAGGMGSVYLVEQLSTGRQRALKIMHPQLARDEESRARFDREARAGARIRSEHVVEVVSAGIDEQTGIPWLAMELLDGEELAVRVKRLGRLPPSEALEVFRQLCHGLGEAHRAGLVHRDLKPENVFIAASRRQSVPFTVKILDFGIAKLAQESQAQMDATRPVGTPRWMAPEQSEHGGQITPATDVWALGLVAFYLLTGRYYWRAANARDGKLTTLLRELVVEPIEPASQRAARFGCAGAIPPGFDAWFARCVVREPEQRMANADRALEELVPVLEKAVAWDGPAPAPLDSSSPTVPESRTAASGEGATLPPGAQATPPGAVTERERPWTEAPAAIGPQSQGALPPQIPLPSQAAPALQSVPQARPPARPQPSGWRRRAPLAAGVALASVALAVVAGVLLPMRARRAADARAIAASKVPPAPAPAAAVPREPVPREPVPREPETLILLFESLPAGADVFEGDHKLGTTPLQLSLLNSELRKQPRSFRLEKQGYRPYSVVQGPSSEAVRVVATLGEDDTPAAHAPAPKASPAPKQHPKPPADEPELRLRR